MFLHLIWRKGRLFSPTARGSHRLITPKALKWMKVLLWKPIHLKWEKSLVLSHSTADALCCCYVASNGFILLAHSMPKFQMTDWVSLFFKPTPGFKNTSKWQVQSEQVLFWRGSVWVRATCDKCSQHAIIRCRYRMHSYIYVLQTDSVKQEKKKSFGVLLTE